MPCPENLRTQAFIDGEVGGAEADEIERHIEACPDCQAFCADAATLSDGIRAQAPRFTAPDDLQARIKASLGAHSRPQSARDEPVRTVPPGFWRGVFSGAGVTALAAGLASVAVLPPSAATLADQVTEAHTTALAHQREIAVVSTDHHTVKPWFAGRVALSPPVADFATQGYKLVGGRVDRVGRSEAAVVVYQHGRHAIDLFVWADRGASLPDRALSHGYHAFFWKKHDLDFAAVSDTSAAELAIFADLVRAEPE